MAKREPWNPLLCNYPDSDKVNSVSMEAETLFTRLLAKCDDGANFEANPTLLMSYLLAKRIESGCVSVTKTLQWRNELVTAGLIQLYEVAGKEYLHIVNCKKAIRTDIKLDIRYPAPPQILDTQEDNETVTDAEQIRDESVTKTARQLHTTTTATTTEKDNKLSFLSESKELQLASLLLTLIREHNPRYKQPDLQKWAKAIDLMIRIDKRPPDEIEKVIRWCQADNFWHVNILSADKLRQQYDKLFMKMRSQNGSTRTQNSNPQGRIYRQNPKHDYADEGTVINV